MTPQEIDAIVADRFGRWAAHLSRDHATPLVVVGCGHDHNSGRIVVVTVDEPDDMTNEVIAGFLRKAAVELDPRQKGAIPL